MADLNITAVISAEDRAEIVADLIAAIRPMIERRTKLLVSEPEMASLASVSTQLLADQRSAGKIPYVQMGTRILYNPDAVIAALNAYESGGADHA